MENKKQSSVDYYDKQLRKLIFSLHKAEISLSKFDLELDKVVEKAKEMHKEEIKESYNQGRTDSSDTRLIIDLKYTSQDYYNETFIQ